MRKHDYECSEPAFFDEMFATAGELFLAMHDGEFPYVLPLNFVRQGNALYIHCALKGHKLDCIRQNPHVAFTLVADALIHREKSTTSYKSLCGVGRAVIVEDEEEKGRALDALARRYNARCPRPTPQSSIRRTGVLRIDMLGVTGRRKLPQ